MLAVLAAVLVLAGCGGKKSDRAKVEDGIRKLEGQHGAVVHAVSCHRYGPLADEHQWTCRVRVDNPNGGPAVVGHTCEVTVGDDASDFRRAGC